MDSENGAVHINAVYAEIRQEIALAHRSLCDDSVKYSESEEEGN